MEFVVYHGSENVVVPEFGKGKPYNDYGQGFYCTENLELAKEWACSHGQDGFVNVYEVLLDGLSILDLNCSEYSILNWLAILLENRKFYPSGPTAQLAREYVIANFLPEYKQFDIIKGYRADDSYFSYAADFLSNGLSLENLKLSMNLGHLGEQFVLKSRKSFDRIRFVELIGSEAFEYYAKYQSRDVKARERYRELSSKSPDPDGIFMMDIIRNNIKNGDPRL